MIDKCDKCGCTPTFLVTLGDSESLCAPCAKETISKLRRHRYQLADVLGHDTDLKMIDGEPINLTPGYKALLKEVKVLVEMKKQLNWCRRFLSAEVWG